MAIDNICALLTTDRDSSCSITTRGWWQQAVLINLSQIETKTVTLPNALGVCSHSVKFSLKCASKGYRVSAIEAGTNIKGMFSKTRDANGYPVYTHTVQIFLAGLDAELNCMIEALDKGLLAVALQTKTGEVLIYGIQNGLSSDDYTYDIVENAGGVIITLSSLENSPEPNVPMIYVSNTPGSEVADFDASFENVTPCP